MAGSKLINLKVAGAERRKRVAHTKVRFATLTPREQEVLRCVIQGHANKKIALMLKMSVRTVEVHRARIMRKMEADTPIALACNLQCASCEYFLYAC